MKSVLASANVRCIAQEALHTSRVGSTVADACPASRPIAQILLLSELL